MKKTWTLMLACMLACFCSSAFAADRINWYTNYDEAVKAAKSSSKPLLLLFTGSDWCTWCKKLDKEVFASPEFANAAADKFIFVMVDFPVNKSLPDNITKQNKDLQKRFLIEGYPTVVILDSVHQKKIATTGYKPGGGAEYAKHLQSLVQSHASYNKKINDLDNPSLTGNELKEMYSCATNLGRTQEANHIAIRGVTSDQNHFFLLERYRLLAEQGKIKTEEAQTIKQQLVASDPTNLQHTHYQLAIIDFETACNESNAKHPNTNETVAALVEYINKFGIKDKEHLWRIQMMISQTYYEDGKLPQALEYAEAAFKSAPAKSQPAIGLTIKNIQAKSNS